MQVSDPDIGAHFDRLVAEADLSRLGLKAWGALLRAHATLMRQLQSDLEQKMGLALADFDVLAQLAGAGGALRMTELAKDAKVLMPPPTTGGFSLGHAVGSKEDVGALLLTAEAAGATVTVPAYDRPFGVYSGYFRDPDGHLWEVIWNPALADI